MPETSALASSPSSESPDPRSLSRVDPPAAQEAKEPFGKAPKAPVYEKVNLPPPPKALLLLANPDGSLKPPFEEYQDVLSLSPPYLTPEWWPYQVENQPLSEEERSRDFQANLEAALPSVPTGSGSATPAKPSLTPQRVLRSLLLLHSVAHQGPAPTLD